MSHDTAFVARQYHRLVVLWVWTALDFLAFFGSGLVWDGPRRTIGVWTAPDFIRFFGVGLFWD